MQTLDIIKRRKSPAPLRNVEEYEGPGVPEASVQHTRKWLTVLVPKVVRCHSGTHSC